MSRDKLNDSQGSGTSKFPRIEVNTRLEIKEDEKGVTAFSYYNYEKKQKEYHYKPITGILIGVVNAVSCYDQNFGNKGGTYRSTYFLTNKDNIVVFDPSNKKVFAGNRDALNEWAMKQGLEKFKIKKRLIVLTKANILVDIETNIILFIDQMNKTEKDLFKDYLITLTAEEFDVDLNPIDLSKKSLEYLGPFARKNKPKYARISQGEPMTDAIWDDYDGDAAADMFIAWKNAIEDGGIDTDSPTSKPEEDVPDNIPNEGYVTDNSENTKENDLAGLPDDNFLNSPDDDFPY